MYDDMEQLPHFVRGRRTSRQLMFMNDAQLKLMTGGLRVTGLEQIDRIPPDRMVIVATSHLTDLDIPATISALGNVLDLAVSDQSSHHKFSDEAAGYAAITLAGKKNFLPIDFQGSGAEKRPAVFNPDNFEPMVEAMHEGKSVLMAAHTPSLRGQLERGGNGVPYLASLTHALILPVAIELVSEENLGQVADQLKTALKRPPVRVCIGEPIEFYPIPGIERLSVLIEKRRQGNTLSDDESAEFSRLSRALRQQSQMLMRVITHMVAFEKRGDYK